MKQPVARFVTRLQGEGDGLIVGALLRGGEHYFRENSVYEASLCQITGDITLKRIGEAVVAVSGQKVSDSPLSLHWAMSIEDILDRGSKYLFLTKEELSTLPVYTEVEDD